MKDTLRFTALATGILVAAAGCGGSDQSGTGGSGGTTATGGAGGQTSTAGGGAGGTGNGGATTGGAGGTTGSGGLCADYQGQAPLAEISASPFADAEAEVLAIEASGNVVAPKHIYERIVSDLAAIRAQDPSVQNVKAMVSWQPNDLLMGFDAVGLAAVQAGTYTAWDCANAWYGFTGYQDQSSFLLLHFDHRFNTAMLGTEYAMFEHVMFAEPNGLFGDGADVCASIENDKTYNYVFDLGSGDCPAGCIDHTYWGFKTDGSPVTITALGTFTNQQQTPAWFSALSSCTKWL